MRRPSVLLALSLMLACSEPKKSASDESAAPQDPVPADPQNETEEVEEKTQETGSLALEFSATATPAESLGIVQNAIQSIGSSPIGTAMVGTVTLDTASLSLGSGYQNENCDGNGYPIAKGDEPKKAGFDELAVNSPSWAPRHFFCLMTVGTSPETMIGSIVVNKGVLCALDKAGALAPAKYGKEQQAKIKIDANCFSKEFVESMNNEEGGGEADGGETNLTADAIEFPVTVTVKKLEADKLWDLEIVVDSGDGPEIYRFRNAKDRLTGMRLQDMAGGAKSGYVYSVGADGAIRFENRLLGSLSSAQSDDNKFSGRKHIRLLAKGKLDPKTLVYKELEQYEAISADLHGDATLATIKGNATAGLFVHGQYCQGGACGLYANFEVAIDQCLESGKCSGNAGLRFDATNFAFGLGGDTAAEDFTDMEEFIAKAKLPLGFDALTFDDLP